MPLTDPLNLHLDADDVAALERFAKAADRPPSWVARKVLCAWLKENALPAQPEEAEAEAAAA